MAKIRHLAILALKDDVDRTKIAAAMDLLRARVPGFTRAAYGEDAGLKVGNGGFGVCFDFADEAAYQKWDTDPEHDRIRRELIFPFVTGISRVQFRVDD